MIKSIKYNFLITLLLYYNKNFSKNQISECGWYCPNSIQSYYPRFRIDTHSPWARLFNGLHIHNKWVLLDLNQRPPTYETGALTN